MSDWTTVARLTRARGNKGELYAIPLSRRSVDQFAGLGRVVLFVPDGAEGRPFEVESVWEHQTRGESRLVFKFRGVDTISEAEGLTGSEVRIPAENREALPDDEFYYSDLTGCEVVERGTGRSIGRVSGVEESGGPVLLKVDGPGGELLIPFARSICVNIDVKARRIETILPEGLAELNR